MIYYSFIYIALSCLILSKLSINVIKLRRQNKVSFGDDGDRTLMRRIRAQANFIEYTPIFLLSLIGIEWLAVENIPYYFLYINIVGSLFIIGRILHALSLYEKKIMHRKTGMIITFVSLQLNGILLLVLVFYKIFFV
tara:strand:+ start:690 stop:1100 length:411 start_codon:yes stop_codon:yes gene_type:complete